MRVAAVVPAWMLGDGEYDTVAVGGASEFGFALESTWLDRRAAPVTLEQDTSTPPVTVVAGTVRRPSPTAPPVLETDTFRAILRTTERVEDGLCVVVRGRLVVEPYLWATDGVLWPHVPDGVRVWSVVAIHCVGSDTTEMKALPGAESVDHAATYVLDLERPSSAGP